MSWLRRLCQNAHGWITCSNDTGMETGEEADNTSEESDRYGTAADKQEVISDLLSAAMCGKR